MLTIKTTDGVKVVDAEHKAFKNQPDQAAAMQASVEERNKRAAEMGIQARYELADN